MKKSSFDDRAAKWDEKPRRIELAKAVADAVRKSVNPDRTMEALEYGCGTGLLGFMLHPFVGRLVMADTSKGMLEVAEKKIRENNLENIKTTCLDLSKEEADADCFDFIFTQMTFHHIPDYHTVAEKFYSMIRKGGILCIADLETEDGSFHENGITVHNGIDPELLSTFLENTGFTDVRHIEAHTIKKSDREYPVFLVTARKN